MKDKLQKLLKLIKCDLKSNYKLYIILLLIISTFYIKLDYYIFSPGGLIELKDRIEIDNDYEAKGSFNMTYVSAKNGILPLILLSYVIPSWDLESIDNSRIEDESATDINTRNQIYLKETSYDGIIAAFTEANKKYSIDSIDLVVTYVYSESKTNILVGDIIKSVDGINITDFNNFANLIQSYKKGDNIKVNVLRDNKIIECTSTLIEQDERIIIGVALAELKNITTNPKINYIFEDKESGSSRGLMCALEIYNRITEYDLTKGDVISGTGTIDENGIVGKIDGVKYKLAGAVKKKAKVFIVPTDNYEEAIKLKETNKYDIEIIEADTLHNVIEKLKNR